MKRDEDFARLPVILTHLNSTSRRLIAPEEWLRMVMKLRSVLEMENHSQNAKRPHQSCMAWVGLSDMRLHAQAAEQPGMGAAPLQKGPFLFSLS